jgi:hypothetical protein
VSDDAARPRFSILMPTRDRPAQLAKAVEAIGAQDFDSWELIIKDAGDVSAALPDDGRIVHLRGPDRNIAHALNIAMNHASGEILNWANDDDPLLPGALRYVDEQIGDAMWLRGRVEYIDHIHGTTDIVGAEPWDIERLKVQSPIWTPGLFWRADAARAVGLMDESVPLACDYDYWIRLGDHWPPIVVDRVLAQYNCHPGTLSQTRTAEQIAEADRIRARYGFIEVERSRTRIHELEAMLAQARNETAAASSALAAIERSRFWRITSPMRRTLSFAYSLGRSRRSGRAGRPQSHE